MNWKKLGAVFCFVVYLFAGNTFSHASSMDLVQEGETVMVMSDCGMMMPVHNQTGPVDDDCFESCFGDYDDFGSATVLRIEGVTQIQNVVGGFLGADVLRSQYAACRSIYPPPDDRCVHISKQTPYFSHSDTTKRE